MILTILYADGTEEAHSVSPNTKLKGLRDDDFFYFSTLEGAQIAINASTVEKIAIGDVSIELDQAASHGKREEEQ